MEVIRLSFLSVAEQLDRKALKAQQDQQVQMVLLAHKVRREYKVPRELRDLKVYKAKWVHKGLLE